VDEGGGVNALDDREGCVLTRFVGAAGLFVLAGAAGVTAVTGSGVLFAFSGETDSAICIALGYKFPIVVWIVFGYESPITVVGAAVIIVTNKNAEMKGTRRRVLLLLSIVLILYHPFFGRGVEFHGLTTNN